MDTWGLNFTDYAGRNGFSAVQGLVLDFITILIGYFGTFGYIKTTFLQRTFVIRALFILVCQKTCFSKQASLLKMEVSEIDSNETQKIVNGNSTNNSIWKFQKHFQYHWLMKFCIFLAHLVRLVRMYEDMIRQKHIFHSNWKFSCFTYWSETPFFGIFIFIPLTHVGKVWVGISPTLGIKAKRFLWHVLPISNGRSSWQRNKNSGCVSVMSVWLPVKMCL